MPCYDLSPLQYCWGMEDPPTETVEPPSATVALASIDIVNVYDVTVTPLKQGGRRDITVHATEPVSAVEAQDFTTAMRSFFMAMEAEARRYVGDPVATSRALAHLEALLADVRYVRDRVAHLAATALATSKVRRLVIEGVIAVEGKTESNRHDWQNARVLTDVIRRLQLRVLDQANGEWLEPDVAAGWLLDALRPDWKITALRALGLDPDDYSTLDREPVTDEQLERDPNAKGRPIREPKIHIIDNRVKGKR